MTGRRRLFFWFAIGAAGTALFVAVLAVLLTGAQTTSSIRHTQVTNTQTLDNTSETLKLIRDCVNPNGECYQRGQRRTAAAVSGITTGNQQAAAAGAACTVQLQRQGVPVNFRTVYRCIVRTTHPDERKH